MPRNGRANRSDLRPYGDTREVATIRMPGIAGLFFATIELPQGLSKGRVYIRDRTNEVYLDATVHDRAQAVKCLDTWMSQPGERTLVHVGADVRANKPPRPIHECPFCHEERPSGLPTCRKSACMIRGQIDLSSRGRVRR